MDTHITAPLDMIMNLVETAPSAEHLGMLIKDTKILNTMKITEGVWEIFQSAMALRMAELELEDYKNEIGNEYE